jgi:protein phosphatase PTC1
MNLNEFYNNKRIYPSYNNNRNIMKKVNNLKNALFNHKYMINPINYIKPSFINSDGKSNNINQEMKLRSTKPNFNGSNKIVIIANNNKSSSNDNKSNKNSNNNNLNTSINNNKSDDMKKTVTSNFSNEEAFPLEKHIDLCFVSYAYNENANLEHRKEMEDFHYIKALLSKKLSCSYFGLFDGHSGKEVGMYLMENLHKIIHQKIKENNDIENIDNLKNIVINSFEQIDQEINSKNFKNETGSTGTVLLLFKDKNSPLGKSLLCANVGDSKAYLITKKEMILITKDHKCCDANEVKRIRDSGGIVFRERVFGTLMLTRSFGDKEMKKYGVLSTPDIFMKNIDTEDIFVVIASDGVWDVVEENEILKMSQGSISSNDFSKKIINLAKERDTHDNISCIVIKLNKNN